MGSQLGDRPSYPASLPELHLPGSVEVRHGELILDWQEKILMKLVSGATVTLVKTWLECSYFLLILSFPEMVKTGPPMVLVCCQPEDTHSSGEKWSRLWF